MQCFLRMAFTMLFLTMVIVGSAQNNKDTVSVEGERIIVPVTPPLKTDVFFNNKPFTAPDQVGFGKLSIESDIPAPQVKFILTDTAYRSVWLYMALTEKAFKEWETENYSKSKKTKSIFVDLNLGDFTPKLATGINLTSITNVFKKTKNTPPPLTTNERLKIHEEWVQSLREKREERMMGKYQEEENKSNNNNSTNPSFALPLYDRVTDYVNTFNYGR